MKNTIVNFCLLEELSTNPLLKEIIDEIQAKMVADCFTEKTPLQFGSMGLNVIALSALCCYGYGQELSTFSIRYHIQLKSISLHEHITLTPSISHYIKLLNKLPHELFMQEMAHYEQYIDKQFINPHVLQPKSKKPVHFTEIALYECDMLTRRLKNGTSKI